MSLFPFVLILAGVAALVFGRRLAVLGATVGVLFGVVLLRLFGGEADLTTQLAVVLGLGLVGFFAAAFARGLIDVFILVLGALAGAAIVLAFLDLFRIDLGLMNWLLAVVGGVIGLMLMRRSRKSTRDWGMIILASLIGALLVTRGLTQLLPVLQGTTIAALVTAVLGGVGVAYQGELFAGRKARQAAQAVPPAQTAPAETSPVRDDNQ